MNHDAGSSAVRNVLKRYARIERVRKEIAEGSYETDAKLEAVLHKLLRELDLGPAHPREEIRVVQAGRQHRPHAASRS